MIIELGKVIEVTQDANPHEAPTSFCCGSPWAEAIRPGRGTTRASVTQSNRAEKPCITRSVVFFGRAFILLRGRRRRSHS